MERGSNAPLFPPDFQSGSCLLYTSYPTEETQKFWDEFEQMNPSNIDEYIAAKRYLEVFSQEKEEVLSNEETDDLWAKTISIFDNSC